MMLRVQGNPLRKTVRRRRPVTHAKREINQPVPLMPIRTAAPAAAAY
jgi:hypothetical protein